MQVTVEIPDDMARRLAPQGQEPARAALEAMAIEGYPFRRAQRLSDATPAGL